MRVLWLDNEQNPWTDPNGFTVLENFGVTVDRVHQVKIAKEKIQTADFDMLIVCAEVPGALEFMPEARVALLDRGKKIILCSAKMTKDDFKRHAKTNGAAHRYACLPVPPEVFLKEIAGLYKCTIDDLRNIPVPSLAGSLPPLELPEQDKSRVDLSFLGLPSLELPASEALADLPSRPANQEYTIPELLGLEIQQEAIPERIAPLKSIRTQNTSSPEGEDVLQKYLHMREEELELLTSERNELHEHNSRLQEEVERLQQILHESEMAREELAKKALHAESGKVEAEEVQRHDKAHFEAELKAADIRLKNFSDKLKDSEERHESLKLRVRKDIRKIRSNEKDLEARLEILRKDSETLLAAREQKLLELQRKIDALEFDLDQVQDSRVQAEMESERYLAKLSRVARALHIAVGVIEEDQNPDAELDEMEPMLGGAAAPAGAEAAPLTASDQPGASLQLDSGEASQEEVKQDDLYAALANDGEPTRIGTLEDMKAASDNDGNNEALG